MKIHGIVYLIVGAFIVGASYYVTSMNESLELQKFMLFIWTGVLFAIIGLFKMIHAKLTKPKKAKVAKENFPQHPSLQNEKNQHQSHHGQQQTNQLVKFCSGCGSAVRHFDNFCYKCGGRMFHRK